jgi:CysZ protein
VLDAVIKSLAQMLSPSFRAVLVKSMGLALILIIVIGVALQRLLVGLAAFGESWAEGVLGTSAHTALMIASWVLSITASVGIIIGSIFLMPAVTALVGSFFVDDIALEVERRHYPDEPLGIPLPASRALVEGARTALISVIVYLLALPALLLAGAGVVIFFVATAYLLGREYFELAAMRYRSPLEAKAVRKKHQGEVFVAGLFIAAFVSIPIVSLATPLFAMALMVHLHKRTLPAFPEQRLASRF